MRREACYTAALMAMVIAYSAAWSYITVAKIYSMGATFADLGYVVQGAWDATHSGPLGALNALLTQSALLVYALPLPLGRHMYEAMAVLQSAWLGAGAVPVYLLARRHLRSGATALALAASYLLYFPMAASTGSTCTGRPSSPPSSWLATTSTSGEGGRGTPPCP